VQPRPQHLSDRGDALAAIRRVGDLGEKPIHQAPVSAVLRLQPLSDPNAEIVANHIGAGLAQHRVRSIDGIQSGTDALPCHLGAHTRTHAPTL
jgi:hypothetical protein